MVQRYSRSFMQLYHRHQLPGNWWHYSRVTRPTHVSKPGEDDVEGLKMNGSPCSWIQTAQRIARCLQRILCCALMASQLRETLVLCVLYPILLYLRYLICACLWELCTNVRVRPSSTRYLRRSRLLCRIAPTLNGQPLTSAQEMDGFYLGSAIVLIFEAPETFNITVSSRKKVHKCVE